MTIRGSLLSTFPTLLVVAACCLSQPSPVQGFATGGSPRHAIRPIAPVAKPAASTTTTTTTTTTRLEAGSADVVAGVGEEGCNLPSVSGINTKGDLAQAFAVKVIFLSLAAGTYGFSAGLHSLTDVLQNNFEGPYGFFRATWPITFGAIYSLAGVTHFTLKEEYENIVPTKGAWGVWNIPGSREFHVLWTGVAELAGGLGLLAGGLSPILGFEVPSLTSAGLESDAAAALVLLTIAVTPANIFMYTHGAKLPIDSDPVPLQFHAVRLALQCVLLGFLYTIGEETFQLVLS